MFDGSERVKSLQKSWKLTWWLFPLRPQSWPAPSLGTWGQRAPTASWTVVTRECWMIYRGPGFLAVVWFGSSCPFPPSPVSKLDRRHTRRRGGRGWARSRIIRLQESLVLYKSFNTLWLKRFTATWWGGTSFKGQFRNFVYSVRARNYKF